MAFPTCQICLEPLLHSLDALPCGHVFHNKCIRSWTDIKANCPSCKSAVRRRQGEYHFLRLFLTFEDDQSPPPEDGAQQAEGGAPKCLDADGGAGQPSACMEQKNAEITKLRHKENMLTSQLKTLLSERDCLNQTISSMEGQISAYALKSAEQQRDLQKARLDAVQTSRHVGQLLKELVAIRACEAKLKAELAPLRYAAQMDRAARPGGVGGGGGPSAPLAVLGGGGGGADGEEGEEGSGGGADHALGELLERLHARPPSEWANALRQQHELLKIRGARCQEMLNEKRKAAAEERELRQKVEDLRDLGRKQRSRFKELRDRFMELETKHRNLVAEKKKRMEPEQNKRPRPSSSFPFPLTTTTSTKGKVQSSERLAFHPPLTKKLRQNQNKHTSALDDDQLDNFDTIFEDLFSNEKKPPSNKSTPESATAASARENSKASTEHSAVAEAQTRDGIFYNSDDCYDDDDLEIISVHSASSSSRASFLAENRENVSPVVSKTQPDQEAINSGGAKSYFCSSSSSCASMTKKNSKKKDEQTSRTNSFAGSSSLVEVTKIAKKKNNGLAAASTRSIGSFFGKRTRTLSSLPSSTDSGKFIKKGYSKFGELISVRAPVSRHSTF